MSFKEVKPEELNLNPFSAIGKEWMLITAGPADHCNTMTASWGGIGVMWGKNVAVHPPVPLHQRICGPGGAVYHLHL